METESFNLLGQFTTNTDGLFHIEPNQTNLELLPTSYARFGANAASLHPSSAKHLELKNEIQNQVE